MTEPPCPRLPEFSQDRARSERGGEKGRKARAGGGKDGRAFEGLGGLLSDGPWARALSPLSGCLCSLVFGCFGFAVVSPPASPLGLDY